MSDSLTINKFIHDFNEYWMHARVDEIIPLLHEDVVFTGPDYKTHIRGRSDCIQTLRDFISVGYTHHFEIINNQIHTWQEVSNCIIEYTIDYEIKGKRLKEHGFEQWTIINDNDALKMLGRVLLKINKLTPEKPLKA